MSVYAEDLLKVPSLAGAEVVAGRGGLRKTISSISVLETVDIDVFTQTTFPNDYVKGSELVITGFLNARDKYDLQLEAVKYLCRMGEAGLILFYIGVYVKEIDPRIIEYANENDFLIICMPRGIPTLMYGDVIRDVMTAIIRDQLTSESVSSALINRPENREKLMSSELVKAILNDDPLRMHQLASGLKIDIASVHCSVIVSGRGLTEKHASELSSMALGYCGISLADIYDSDIVLFTSPFSCKDDINCFVEGASNILPEDHCISFFSGQNTTTDVRSDFLMNKLYLPDAHKILPGRRFFTRSDIFFARSCRNLIEAGDIHVREILMMLEPLSCRQNADELRDLLAIFLLDTDRSVQKTADRLFVHKNTVKYRLKLIEDIIGADPGEIPGSIRLCTALAIRRMLC